MALPLLLDSVFRNVAIVSHVFVPQHSVPLFRKPQKHNADSLHLRGARTQHTATAVHWNVTYQGVCYRQTGFFLAFPLILAFVGVLLLHGSSHDLWRECYFGGLCVSVCF